MTKKTINFWDRVKNVWSLILLMALLSCACPPGGDIRTSAEDFKSLKLAADQGNAEAQYNLAVLYCAGKSVAKNFIEMERYFRLAADQGDAEAQFILGLLYEDGEYVAANSAEAFRYYNLAADQGHIKAQFRTGEMYAHGWGVKADVAEASRYYKLAADQGNAEAQGVPAIYPIKREHRTK